MVKGLKLFLGMLAMFILLGLTVKSYAEPVASCSSFTIKSVSLKNAGQLAEVFSDAILHTGLNIHQLNYLPDLYAETAVMQQAGFQCPVINNAPQTSSIYKLRYYRFILYPFHAFW